MAFTPLLLACNYGAADIAHYLLEKGANKNALAGGAFNGRNALHVACLSERPALECVKVLVQCGINKDAMVGKGITPLLCAINRHLDCVRFLIDSGLDGIKNVLEAFAIAHHMFQRKGKRKYDVERELQLKAERENLVKYLFNEKKADLTVVDYLNATYLLYAVVAGNLNLVTFFVEKGISIDQADRRGNTPLLRAIDEENEDNELDIYRFNQIASYLIEMRASELAHCQGITPLLKAAAKGNNTILELLINRGAQKEALSNDKENAIHLALFNDHSEMIKLLVKNNVSLDIEDCRGRTPLSYALYAHNNDIANYLIESHASVEKALKDKCVDIDSIVESADRKLIEKLLAHGIPIDQPIGMVGRVCSEHFSLRILMEHCV